MGSEDNSNWLRIRFEQPTQDFRPVKFPPPGPYWCSGHSCTDEGDTPILIAYLKTEEQLKEYWTEAQNISLTEECDHITFTTRFPKPKWWK